MQVYKAFFKILWQQKITLSIYIFLFLGFCFCFASTGQSSAKESFEEYGYSIVITDEDHTDLSEAVVKYLCSINTIKDISSDEEKLQDALYARTIVAAVTIPKGYEENLLAGKETPLLMMTIPGTRYATGVETQIDRFMRPLTSYLCTGLDAKNAVSSTFDTLEVETKVFFPDEQGNGEHTRAYYFFLYSPYVMIAIYTVGIGPAFIVFKKKSIRERILASSYTYLKQSLELILAMLSAGVVFYLLVVVLGGVFCGKDYFEARMTYVILNGLVFSSVALSLSFLASAFATDNNILNMIGNVAGLGICFLGGIFVPMEVMGKGVENVAKFVPSYWYVKTLEELDKTGFDMSKVLIGMGIQVGFAIVITSVTFAIMKAKKAE